MGTRPWSIPLIVAVLCTPTVAAHDVPVSGSIDSHGSATLMGVWNGTASAVGVVHWQNILPEVGPVAANGCRGHLTIMDDPMEVFNSDPVGPAPGSHFEWPLPTEKKVDTDFSGGFSLTNYRPEATLRVIPAQPRLLTIHSGTMSLEPSLPQLPLRYQFEPLQSPVDVKVPLHGGHLAAAQLPIETDDGSWTWYVFGATLTLAQGSDPVVYDTGLHANPVAPGTPFQPARLDRIYAVITTADCRPELGGPGWVTELQSWSGTFAGQVSINAIQAETIVNRTQRSDDAGQISLQGAFNLATTFQQQDARWKIDGRASSIKIDGIVIPQSPSPDLPILVGAGFSIVALLYGLARLLRNASIPGYNHAKPLENQTRIQILRMIADQPGITRPDLQREVGRGRATISFHLKVLQKHHLVDIENRGRIEHYQLNSGHYRTVMGSPTKPVFSSAILASMRHAKRRQILDALARLEGPATFQQIAERIDGRTMMSQSLFLYHMKKLEDTGAVQKTASGQWVQGIRLQDILASQRKEFLAEGGRALVLEICSNSPGSSLAEQVQEAIERRLGSRKHVLNLFREMYAFGFLDRNAKDGYSVRPLA